MTTNAGWKNLPLKAGELPQKAGEMMTTTMTDSNFPSELDR